MRRKADAREAKLQVSQQTPGYRTGSALSAAASFNMQLPASDHLCHCGRGPGGVLRHRTLNPQIIRLISNRTPEKSPIQTHQNSTSVSPPSVTPSPAHPNQTNFNLPSRKRAYPVTRWTSHPPQPPSALSPLPPGAGRCIHPGGWCVEKSRFPADRKMYVGRHLQVPGRLQDRISCSPFNVARRGVSAAMGEGSGCSGGVYDIGLLSLGRVWSLVWSASAASGKCCECKYIPRTWILPSASDASTYLIENLHVSLSLDIQNFDHEGLNPNIQNAQTTPGTPSSASAISYLAHHLPGSCPPQWHSWSPVAQIHHLLFSLGTGFSHFAQKILLVSNLCSMTSSLLSRTALSSSALFPEQGTHNSTLTEAGSFASLQSA